MPQKTVNSVVTEKVLRMDKQSCEHILKAILEDKKRDEYKKKMIEQEKLIKRNKTVFKHN